MGGAPAERRGGLPHRPVTPGLGRGVAQSEQETLRRSFGIAPPSRPGIPPLLASVGNGRSAEEATQAETENLRRELEAEKARVVDLQEQLEKTALMTTGDDSSVYM